MNAADKQEAKQLLEQGVRHLDNQQIAEALKVLTTAAKLDPTNVHLWCVLGHAQERMGLFEIGRQSFTRAYKLNPRYPLALRNLASAELNIGNTERSLALADAAAEIEPDNPEIAALLLAATVSMSVDANALHARHVRAAKVREAVIVPLPKPSPHQAGSEIRIGYFSHHFYRFPLASFLPHVIAAHDRSKFRVYVFAAHGTMDAVTDEYIQSADEFHDLTTMNDDEAAAYIRARDIDVLIDMSGLVQFNRFGILSRRPARVQMSWLGYFSSPASAAIDFHLTDEYANPPGQTEHLFSEKLLRLPRCQYAYRPMVADVPVAPSPLQHNRFVTFGWFCVSTKLNAVALAAYANIVAAVPDSRIVFVAASKDLQQQIVKVFLSNNVKRQRITFLPKMAPDAYFRALSTVDICLDAFPMVGGTAVCDAIWMGTPVISMFLPRGFGGASSSILNQVGLGQWIAHDVDSYIANAIRLADARETIIDYRKNLRKTMQQSPLMDTAGMCRALESVFSETIASTS
jgi:protein O-GlcNAc transferase